MNTPENPLLETAQVEALLPHTAPMIMIDTLWLSEGKRTVSGFTVKADNIFCVDAILQEPALIENVAQTAAIRMGYQALLAVKGKDEQAQPPFGYIAAVKNCQIYRLPSVDDVLKTEIIVKGIVRNVHFIEGTVFLKGEVLLECEMRIYQEVN